MIPMQKKPPEAMLKELKRVVEDIFET